MFTPVPAILPDSTLAPAGILAKFSSQSLAGLGWGPSGMGDCPCLELDDSGNCLDTTSVGCGTTVSTPVTASPSPVVSTVVATGSCDPGYDYVPAANGCLPQAGLTTTSGGSQVSGGSSSSLLSPQLLTALAQGSLTAAQLALAPSPIVVKPIATTTALTSSTVMLLLLLGVGGVLLMSESRKGGR
jgi:hypothetical protein